MKKIYLITAIFICAISILPAQFQEPEYWSQISKSLPEPYENSQYQKFGHSIEIYGNYAAVGAPGYGGLKGCVYVLHFDGAEWKKIAKLTASDAESGQFLGYSVSIWQNTIVAGAKGDPTEGAEAGAVYVFQKPEAGWTDTVEVAKFIDERINGSDNFGCSVDIEENTIVVGSFGYSGFRGAVFVYEQPADGVWKDTLNASAFLSATDIAGFDRLGNSVAISGNTIVAGAYGDSDKGTNAGALYVYEKPSSGWTDITQSAKLLASDGSSADQLGRDVDIEGDLIVSGAYLGENGGVSTGAGYLYEKPAGGWQNMTETAKLSYSLGERGDQVGMTVSVGGNTVLLGCQGYNEGYSPEIGCALVYKKPATGWQDMTETAILTSSAKLTYSNFSAGLANTDDFIIVGAPQSYEEVTENGSVLVYQLPAGGWNSAAEDQKILPDSFESNSDDEYGRSVAMLDSSIAVIGSPGYDDNKGVAYIKKIENGEWITLKMLSAADGEPGDNFGAAVAISESTVVVGSPGDNGNFTDEGSIYIFEKGTEGWESASEVAKLTSSVQGSNYKFGGSVAIDDNVVVAGSRMDSDKGAVCVFEKPVTGWENATQTARLTADDGTSSDLLGHSVDIAGNVIVGGAYGNKVSGNYSGAAYIFEKTGDNWEDGTQTAKITASDATTSLSFGVSVAIWEDVIAIGASGNNSGRGAVYVFEEPAGGWKDTTQTAKLTSGSTLSYQYLGSSVDIFQDKIVAGAYSCDFRGNASGAVYFFEKQSDHWENMTEKSRLFASDAAQNDHFGWAVAISGYYAICTANEDADNGLASGSAYLIERSRPIVVNQYPEDQLNACTGEEVEFTYDVSYAKQYQWMVSSDGFHYRWIEEGFPYSGTQTNSLKITVQDSLDGRIYMCMVRNNVYELDRRDVHLRLDTLPPEFLIDSSKKQLQGDEADKAILPDYTIDASVDNCSDILIEQFPVPGTIVSGTENVVRLYSTDERGNTDSLSFIVEVVEEPIIPDDPDDPGEDPNEDPTNIRDLKNNAIKVFPNPTQGCVTINLVSAQKVQIELISLTGKIIYTQEHCGSQITLDLSDYPESMYILKLKNENNVLTEILVRD